MFLVGSKVHHRAMAFDARACKEVGRLGTANLRGRAGLPSTGRRACMDSCIWDQEVPSEDAKGLIV